MSKKDVLIGDLSKVLEKYFTPENLRNDMYLTQILTKQQFVTLEEILRLSLVKKTLEAAEIPEEEQQELLLQAIRKKANLLTLYDNDQYVIPKIPQNRTTLILRDLPEDATLEEIKGLLDNPACENVKDIHPDVNKTWFVTFETEEDCVKGATWIQLNAKLRGEKVRCRIKSEHSQKSYFGAASVPKAGNPYAQPRPYAPAQLNAYQGFNPQDDPEFLRWLERNPDMVPPQMRSATRRSPKQARAGKKKPEDDDIDYDGIFKLINRQTFEMVVNRYLGNFVEGPEKPENFGEHRSLMRNAPANSFLTLEELDL